MEITIKGDKRRVEKLLKVNSLFMKRNKLALVENEKVISDNEPKLTANQVAELITECKSIDELFVYESDTRQIVKAAFNKKLKELE